MTEDLWDLFIKAVLHIITIIISWHYNSQDVFLTTPAPDPSMRVATLLSVVIICLANSAPQLEFSRPSNSTISKNSETTCPGDNCLQNIQITNVDTNRGRQERERFVGQMMSIGLCSSFVTVLLFGCLVYCATVCAVLCRKTSSSSSSSPSPNQTSIVWFFLFLYQIFQKIEQQIQNIVKPKSSLKSKSQILNPTL